MLMMWWHWLIIGFLLLGLELFFPSYPMIWFGLGAMATGIITVFFPDTSPLIQALAWILVSLCCTHLWRNYLRPRKEQKLRHPNIVQR